MTAARTVVLLDDSEIILGAARACLEARGYAVRTAANLGELERALAATRADLFVLDVQMPEMFGDDLAQVLREVRSLRVPIVLFSDIDEESLDRRGREAGVAACVPTRAGLPGLLARIDALLGAV